MVVPDEDQREQERARLDEQDGPDDGQSPPPQEPQQQHRERAPGHEQDVEQGGQQPQNLQHEDNAEGARQQR